MTKLITQSKTYYRSSQEKTSKTPRNLYKHPVCIKPTSIKSLNKQSAIQLAEYFLSYTENQRLSLDILLNMTGKYSIVTPSQSWIAKQVECTPRTIVTATNRLSDRNHIKKIKRDWLKIDTKKRIYVSKTCIYERTAELNKDIKFLSKYLPKKSKIYKKLVSWIPSLIVSLCFFFTPPLRSSYKKINIDYVSSKSRSFYGLDNHQIAKIYKNKEILPTTTPYKLNDPSFKLPKTHPANIHYEDYPYAKFKNNSLSISAVLGDIGMGNESPEKGSSIDPRFCKKSYFRSLTDKEKIAAHRYCRGKRLYGSVAEYEELLINLGKSKQVWLFNVPSDTILSEKDVQLIKSLPQPIVYYLKQLLFNRPDRKNDMLWIMDACIVRCKKMNIPNNEIKSLLRKYGYNDSRFLEPNKTSYKSNTYRYQRTDNIEEKNQPETIGEFPSDDQLPQGFKNMIPLAIRDKLRAKMVKD